MAGTITGPGLANWGDSWARPAECRLYWARANGWANSQVKAMSGPIVWLYIRATSRLSHEPVMGLIISSVTGPENAPVVVLLARIWPLSWLLFHLHASQLMPQLASPGPVIVPVTGPAQ